MLFDNLMPFLPSLHYHRSFALWFAIRFLRTLQGPLNLFILSITCDSNTIYRQAIIQSVRER